MSNVTFDPHGEHRMAGHFFRQSADDYAAARCCLLNGLFPGFVMAEQAVEKLIKGFIITKDASFKPKPRQGHDLAWLCTKLQELYPHISIAPYERIIKLLQACYDGRYPDSGNDRFGLTTAELKNIDDLYMYLADLVPIEGEMKMRIGVFSHLYSAYLNLSNIPDGKWMLHGNEAALRLLTGRPIPEIILRWRDATLKNLVKEQQG
ncbi:HEPN domain-containing protein [Caballeronia sp. LjRoot31]|uniref:HEPN domain-containing protein n=1 Tax=Caballeronia sp. LjRoot31 TaxID=3342324 RepID=UPI003ECD076D